MALPGHAAVLFSPMRSRNQAMDQADTPTNTTVGLLKPIARGEADVKTGKVSPQDDVFQRLKTFIQEKYLIS